MWNKLEKTMDNLTPLGFIVAMTITAGIFICIALIGG